MLIPILSICIAINSKLLKCKKILNDNLKMLDVKEDVQRRHNKEMQKRLARTNWNSGCKSWYLTEDGFNATMYPGFATQYAAQMAEFEERDYETV